MLNVQILAAPITDISRRTGAGFIVADLLADLFPAGVSDVASFAPEGLPGLSVEWGTMPQLDAISGLGCIQFLPDGTVRLGPGPKAEKARAGLFILPRVVPLDSQIGANRDDLDGDNTDLNWDTLSGVWRTVRPRNSREGGGGTAIYNTGSAVTQKAKMRGTLPANRCFRLDIETYGKDKSGPQPRLRPQWGEEWSLLLAHGMKPTLERKRAIGSGTPDWGIVQTLNNLPTCNLLGGHFVIWVLRIDGRLVILFENNGAFTGVWFHDYELSSTGRPQDARAKDVSWIAAPLRLNAQNCRARLEVAMVKWLLADGSLLTGSLSRHITRRSQGETEAVGSCGGWVREGTQANVTVESVGDTVSYSALFVSGPDGISTPFVDRIQARYRPTFGEVSPTTVNLRPGAIRLSVSQALPPILAGAEASIELDRDILAAKVPGWESVTQQWCPVEIWIGANDRSPRCVFSGYVFGVQKTSAGIGDRKMRLLLRDPIFRTQRVGEVYHALIDQRFPPLDLLFSERLAGAGGGVDGLPVGAGADLYAAHCVQETARIQFGDGVADTMNGNGNALRFLPDGQPPILSTRSDAAGYYQVEAALGGQNALTSHGWIFPAPHGDALYDWWCRLSRDDRAIFYWGWPDGEETGPPVLMYGRYYNLIGAATRRRIYDANYGAGTVEKLIRLAQTERRPDKGPNRAAIWGPTAPGLEGLLPSLRMADGSLPSSDANSATRTWERTILVRDAWAVLGAEAIRDGLLAQLRNVSWLYPTITVRGDERIRMGDILDPRLDGAESDDSLELDGLLTRADRIDHEIDFLAGDDGFSTTLTPRPLTGIEAALAAGLP